MAPTMVLYFVKLVFYCLFPTYRHGLPGMFGWHTVPSDAREIVLTADEFDAMAVYQATSFPAISLPLGLSSLPPEVSAKTFQKKALLNGSLYSATTEYHTSFHVEPIIEFFYC